MPGAPNSRTVKVEPDGPAYVEDEPLEEWSRAITSPDRVILLRQSSRKIYYTSTLPPAGSTVEATALREADATFLADYFSLNAAAGITLPELYSAWAAIDPALFGKAYSQSRMPRGVRVLRQNVWECLIAWVSATR